VGTARVLVETRATFDSFGGNASNAFAVIGGGSSSTTLGALGCGARDNHMGFETVRAFAAQNDSVQSSSDITFPGGISVGTPYFIRASFDANQLVCAMSNAINAETTTLSTGTFGTFAGLGASNSSAHFDYIVIYALGP
jgi:hypothetical protein